MTLPNFVILGAAKAGTTALYEYLRQHPQVAMTYFKETNYFALAGEQVAFRGPGDAETINCFTVTTLEEYYAQFNHAGNAKAIGDASPLYLYHPQAPGRIRRLVPHAKLVAILRHPVERAYSAFLHLVRDGRETTTDFAEALALEEERIRDRWEHIWHYRAMGFYYEQLRRYYDLFHREQIRVYTYEAFQAHPLDVLRDLFRFLDVDDSVMPDCSVRHNATSLPPERRPLLASAVRAELDRAYRDDILMLQSLTGLDLSHWPSDLAATQPVASNGEGMLVQAA